MLSQRRRRDCRPQVETLEGRALLSTATVHVAAAPAVVQTQAKRDPRAVAAILAALQGGPGREFATLLRRQVPDLMGLLFSFTTGARRSFEVKGLAAQLERWEKTYKGPRTDQSSAVAAGAIILPGNRLEVGTILRGEINRNEPTHIVFGIDRGGGRRVGPAFRQRPAITPDALVTISIAPRTLKKSGTITDLRTGRVKPIDPKRIQVQGAVVRAFLPLKDLPSRGLKPAQYRFAMWTRSDLKGGVANVGTFLPATKMIPVGVL